MLGVITLVTPAWSYAYGGSFTFGFLWGGYVHDWQFDFIPTEEPIAYLGDIAALIVIISLAILIFAGIFAKVKDRDINLLYLIGGILPIIAAIIYIAGIAVEYSGWWSYYSVNAASILPFISGGLGIFAGVMGILKGRKF
ncbi:MAG: hypothetical protein ACFE9Z_01025 [Promethearchaeota archaeon]